MAKRLMICSCLGSQAVDADRIEAVTGLSCSRLHGELCGAEIGEVARAYEAGAEDVIVACGQEAARFAELAEEMGATPGGFVDLRDRAGWHGGEGDAGPKQAALAAEALLPAIVPRAIDVESAGACLVIGDSAIAAGAARRLAGVLAVTWLQTDAEEIDPLPGVDQLRGRLAAATGALGHFELRFDALSQRLPGGREAEDWSVPRDGARTQCDIILDLSGAQPLFPAHHKREGYLRADPGRAEAVFEAVFDAAQLVGTFEQPLHVRLEPSLCAHSRAEQTGCTRCLDLCPTGAISPDGEHVSVDPLVCAGCGACSAVCPSGAISYDAPPGEELLRRISTLASAWRRAGGGAARMLVHDEGHGAEMIALAARHGRGLPVDVIPLSVPSLSLFGHAEALAALAGGFGGVEVLMGPATEAEPLESQAALANALAGREAVALIAPADPDALSAHLFDAASPPPLDAPALAVGARRQVARLAAQALQPDAEAVALPEGAPYGAVLVDTEACTLCLSCVSLCPSGALLDNPDMPQLRFQEDACLQCGICATVCPEDAIALQPRMVLTAQAFEQVVLHEEEPFACVECGKLFGVKSTVEKITEKLAGKHAMFASSQAARMIQMCDDCRVNAQYHMQGNPLSGPERPRVRTSDDYFSKRRDH